MNLNSDQLKLVHTLHGYHRVLAGPGAGKSSTLVERFKHLVSEGYHPDHILCLTFTNMSAADMKKKAATSADSFKTFHSFGYQVLQNEKGRVPVEPDLRHRLLSKLCKKYGADYKELAGFISKMRRNQIEPDAAEEFSYLLARCFREYEQERRAGGWLDFESMLIDSVVLLENKDVRARYQRKFVMVDEAQDTDHLQHRMAELITEEYGNLCWIGDPNQNIYQWRDANPEILLNNTGGEICLGVNYRSSQNIVAYVKKHTPTRTPLTEAMQAARDFQGPPIEYKMYKNELEEAEAAIAAARADPLNSCILARTNRLLAPLENICLEHGVKYSLLGDSGFWKRSEVRKVIERLAEYKHVPAAAATKMVVGAVSEFYQVEDATKEDNEALGNLRTLTEISKKFNTTSELIRFATKAFHAKKARGVTIGTIHSAKGLEFKNVFLIACRDGVIPHIKGIPDEEARIFYVAISRAADRLRISFVGQPSEFIRAELTPEILLEIRENYDKVEKLVQQATLF